MPPIGRCKGKINSSVYFKSRKSTTSFKESLKKYSYAESPPSAVTSSTKFPSPITPPKTPVNISLRNTNGNLRRSDRIKKQIDDGNFDQEKATGRKLRNSSTIKDDVVKEEANHQGMKATSTVEMKNSKMPSFPNASLPPTPDYLAFGMDILFCGINPGLKSSEKGHYFAGHQNCFWKYLCGSGLVSGDIDCTFDHLLPSKYNYGLTNLVKRVTRSSSDLTTQDYKTGVPILMNKVLRYKPRILCFVGKQIYQMFLKNGGGNSSEKNFRWGLQPERIGYLSYDLIKKEDEESEVKQEKIDIGWNSTSIFVMPSTSARTASIQQVEKLVFFEDLKRVLDEMRS